MKTSIRPRKICDSMYHQKWFRVLLILVGIDMIILGFTVAIGMDILSIIPYLGAVTRIVFGLLYITAALFMIHYAVAYERIKKESHFVCAHCSHIENK